MMSGTAVPTLTEDRLLVTWLGEGATGSGLGLGSWKDRGGLGFLRGERGCGTPPTLPLSGLKTRHPIWKIPFDNIRNVRTTHLAKQ